MQKVSIIIVILMGAFVLLLAVPSWLSFDKQKAEVTKNIDLIEIDTAGINTVIIPKQQNEIEAELDGKGFVTVKEHGDSIKVEYERKWYQHFTFFNRNKLTIYIPESYNRDLEIEVGSGNLLLDGKANDLHINHLSLEAGSGNIQIEKVKSKEAVIDVHSGNVDVKKFAGQLKADVSSGNLKVEFDRLQDSVQTDVSSGHLTLKLPENADFTLDSHISSGKISSDFPLKHKVESKNKLKGVHGNGKHQLELSVSSGRIQIIH